MCYLVAKHIDEVGSVALKTTHGKHFSELKRSIEEQVGYKKFNLSRSADPQLMENIIFCYNIKRRILRIKMKKID